MHIADASLQVSHHDTQRWSQLVFIHRLFDDHSARYFTDHFIACEGQALAVNMFPRHFQGFIEAYTEDNTILQFVWRSISLIAKSSARPRYHSSNFRSYDLR